MRDDLLQLYTNATEESEPSSSCGTPLRRNESSVSLQNYLHLELLQQKLRSLETENLSLKHKALQMSTETLEYENKEEELVMKCVKELGDYNAQLASVSEELARKIEDSARQQEEISVLLAQIVELQHKCRTCTAENEELTQELAASREGQEHLKTELQYTRDKYFQCGEMLREAQEDLKNLRTQSGPNSCINRYLTVPVYPMDSLAAEIEGTMRRGFHLDGTGSLENSNYHRRVFETVRAANQAVKLKSRSQSPQNVPGSSSGDPSGFYSLPSTPHTGFYGSSTPSIGADERPPPLNLDSDTVPGDDGERKLGTPGTPGCRDLEVALQRLSLRQQSSQDQAALEQELERQLTAPPGDDPSSSGVLTPAESVLSMGTNYSGSSGHTAYSGLSVGSYPDKLKIVKPLEGSATLHQWKQLAQPHLGGILEPRPGVLTKDFCQLETCADEVYNLHDLEEDEPDYSLFQQPAGPPPEQPRTDVNGIDYRSRNWLPDTQSTYTITTCRIMHPSDEHPSVTMSLHYTPEPSIGSFGKLRPTSSDGNLQRLHHLASGGGPHGPQTVALAPGAGRACSDTMGSGELGPSGAPGRRRRCQSESATNCREHTTTTSTSLGLVTLLKEHGISAAMYDPGGSSGKGTPPGGRRAEPRWDSPPPRRPFLTSSLATSMLSGRRPAPPGAGGPSHRRSERNIFSFNLVEKLSRLGLDQVVARGRVDPAGKGPST
ncbi:trafficking kinesin-binding protein 1-like [Hypanus sabinus]|uniref:trafficking kinesin-binding protein 1-like n=1 Tax=Hypanus sabinus TaxID=79690 RepID=UPI0028C429E5|nr:trafficking kinesin-binding protein 1-like [Hypanus sabinus]